MEAPFTDTLVWHRAILTTRGQAQTALPAMVSLQYFQTLWPMKPAALLVVIGCTSEVRIVTVMCVNG